jgi:deoxyadenosine/deoxycytidine kinase
MILSHIPEHPDRFYALERSVYCDRYCFAQNCYESGFMSHLEWQIYKEWFSWLVESYTPKPHGFIYLRVAPETCIQRIQIRNRFEESNLSIDYLNSLHKKHDDWLMHKKDISLELSKIPILVLNCNKDFEHDTKELEKHLDNAKKFISSLEIKTKEKEISL